MITSKIAKKLIVAVAVVIFAVMQLKASKKKRAKKAKQ